jgi:hypothetical protein
LNRDEGGAVLAIVALSMIALLGMAVLVVDVGGLLLAKRKMVTAADSAALAAAQECASDRLTHDFNSAKNEAFAVAKANGAIAGKIALISGSCPGNGGRVSARYRFREDLSFAPILGLGENLTVSSSAEAIWGAAGSATATPPMNLYADPGGQTFPCAFEAHHPCNFWLDNSSPFAESSSNWSFLALEAPGWPADQAGNSATRTCNNSGSAADLPRWTAGLETRLVGNPTYVCAIKGSFGGSGGTPAQGSAIHQALLAMKGKIFHFPVTDPSLEPDNTTHPGNEKFAVVGFTVLRITEVFTGPENSGSTGNCPTPGAPFVFTEAPPVKTFNASLLSATCLATLPAGSVLDDPVIRDRSSGNKIPASSYVWNSATKTITITNFPNNGVRDVLISFPWGAPGPCGFHSDPNGFCVVTQWVGNRLGGGLPNPDPNAPNFGLGAIRLVQ